MKKIVGEIFLTFIELVLDVLEIIKATRKVATLIDVGCLDSFSHDANPTTIEILELESFFRKLIRDIFASVKDGFKILPLNLNASPDSNDFIDHGKLFAPNTDFFDEGLNPLDISETRDLEDVVIDSFLNVARISEHTAARSETFGGIRNEQEFLCGPEILDGLDFPFDGSFTSGSENDCIDFIREVVEFEGDEILESDTFVVELLSDLLHQLLPVTSLERWALELGEERKRGLEVLDVLLDTMEGKNLAVSLVHAASFLDLVIGDLLHIFDADFDPLELAPSALVDHPVFVELEDDFDETEFFVDLLKILVRRNIKTEELLSDGEVGTHGEHVVDATAPLVLDGNGFVESDVITTRSHATEFSESVLDFTCELDDFLLCLTTELDLFGSEVDVLGLDFTENSLPLCAERVAESDFIRDVSVFEAEADESIVDEF